MKQLMKWSYMAVFLTIGVIVFFSCRKMLSDVSIDKMALSESIQKVKAEFVKLDYSALFVEKRLNDTSTVFKELQWNFATQVTENGIVYTHIPLRSRGKSLKGKIFNINAVGAKEYVIAAQKGDELSFSTALYIFDAIKFKSFKNFTGALITKELKTGREGLFTYLNGNPKNSATSQVALQSQERRLNTVYCQTVYLCQYISTCGGGFSYTFTYSTGGCVCPTYTFASNSGCSSPLGNECVPNSHWWYNPISSYTFQDCWDTNAPAVPASNSLPYVRIEITNEVFTSWYDGDFYREQRTADLFMRFYADAECSIPVVIGPTEDLNYFKYYGYVNSLGGSGQYTYLINGLHNMTTYTTQLPMGNFVTYTYQLYPDPYYGTMSDEVDFAFEMTAGDTYNPAPTSWY